VSALRIRELLVDAQGCAGPLDDPDALERALRLAADAVGADVRGHCVVRFVPHGVTAVLVLAESHILVSTWPEHGLALVDILLCNADMDPQRAWASMSELLRPRETIERTIDRVVDPLPRGA
jgi:S-adenosylmethionine decarboxylase